jgi:hypothetical protein
MRRFQPLISALIAVSTVDAFPAGAICPGTMYQNNIPNAMLCVLG